MKPFTQYRLTLGCLTAALAIAASAPSSFAAGMIGKRHLSATYQHTWVESAAFKDGDGYSAFANLPLNIGTKLDLGLGYNRLEKTSDRAGQPDITTSDIQGFVTLAGPTVEATPYLRLGLGWADWSASDGNEADDGIYSISAGAEMFQTAEFALTPYVTWMDSFSGDIDGRLTYGAWAEWSPTHLAGILLRIEGDDHYNFSAGIGAVIRF